MPADDGKRKAARETIDILYEISTLLVRFFSLLIITQLRLQYRMNLADV